MRRFRGHKTALMLLLNAVFIFAFSEVFHGCLHPHDVPSSVASGHLLTDCGSQHARIVSGGDCPLCSGFFNSFFSLPPGTPDFSATPFFIRGAAGTLHNISQVSPYAPRGPPRLS